jgi:hypothetical protein
MSTKVAAIITVTDGIPTAHTVGHPGVVHAAFRQIKKGGWQGFEEAYELNQNGIDSRMKFTKPETPPAPKKVTRKKKTAE